MEHYSREAFHAAQRASVALNFHAARAILSEIVVEKISDPDVAKYVEFCDDLAEYCIIHGIQRSADLNPWSVVASADYEKAASTLVGRWWQRGIIGPVGSLVGGGWLAFRLNGWVRLQDELVARYGLPVSE